MKTISCEIFRTISQHLFEFWECIKFLEKQADSLCLAHQIFYPANDTTKPVLLMTWEGQEPSLPSILLNSHMDVVPVFENEWKYPPFEAQMDEDGKIYARGSQDMKCVGTQYLAGIRKLQKEGFKPKRTVHLSFVPDEEIGGYTGMCPFVHSDAFKSLNIGFTLDEGLASENEVFQVYNAERSLWQIKFKFNGSSGHGLMLLKKTAGEKFQYVLSKLMEYRAKESERLNNPKNNLSVGDVTSINLTTINGGVQFNIIPPYLEATFDMRVAIDINLERFSEQIQTWCEEAGSQIELEWIQKLDAAPATKVDSTNPFWMAMKTAFESLNLPFEVHVFPGGTDSIFVRQEKIPAIGFSPIINTKIRLHDHNEYLEAEIYLKGIEIYSRMLEKLTET